MGSNNIVLTDKQVEALNNMARTLFTDKSKMAESHVGGINGAFDIIRNLSSAADNLGDIVNENPNNDTDYLNDMIANAKKNLTVEAVVAKAMVLINKKK